MAKLKESPFELIVNPEDAAPSRDWVLQHLKDPELVAACIMHGQASDKVDAEFIEACGPGVKCISTFSVGFGESACLCPTSSRPSSEALSLLSSTTHCAIWHGTAFSLSSSTILHLS